MVVPAGTVTVAPSMVSVTSGMWKYPGAMECWRNGVLGFGFTHHSKTPVLHHSHSYFSNISGHNFTALNIAVAAVWPRPHRDASIIVAPTSERRWRSPVSGFPAAPLSRISNCRLAPSWQG